ncbi:hypothetical protein ACJMK2_009888 [Sinanodonta woodiana]|uniref:Uncharacterized protein n=1 Tax=Sinanodonta woodiana TaxID=1069815 RepID=A0ABD3VDX1_SINWO
MTFTDIDKKHYDTTKICSVYNQKTGSKDIAKEYVITCSVIGVYDITDHVVFMTRKQAVKTLLRSVITCSVIGVYDITDHVVFMTRKQAVKTLLRSMS